MVYDRKKGRRKRKSAPWVSEENVDSGVETGRNGAMPVAADHFQHSDRANCRGRAWYSRAWQGEGGGTGGGSLPRSRYWLYFSILRRAQTTLGRAKQGHNRRSY